MQHLSRLVLMIAKAVLFILAVAYLCPVYLIAQDNYEIQVYGADTVEPHSTMVEFHTNWTAQGEKSVVNGVRPTNHAVHETIEIPRDGMIGLRLVFISLPAPAQVMAGIGWGTIYVLASAFRRNGIGPWA